MDPSDDHDRKRYKFGIFYHHKDNPKIFVPKGSGGIGWTLNFANRWSYVILLLTIAIFILGVAYGFTH